MRDIKAAMTEEEWEHKEFMVGPIGPGDKLFGFIRDATGALHIGWNGEPLRPVADTAPLAALALYGQPFGFTREDVTAIRDRTEADAVINTKRSILLDDLADRIEALLPPAPPEG